MWRDVLTIITFVVFIFLWFEVKPPTIARLFRSNRFFAVVAFLLVIGMTTLSIYYVVVQPTWSGLNFSPALAALFLYGSLCLWKLILDYIFPLGSLVRKLMSVGLIVGLLAGFAIAVVTTDGPIWLVVVVLLASTLVGLVLGALLGLGLRRLGNLIEKRWVVDTPKDSTP